eukprot:SAG11_NODE_5912_length_1434_cov_3.742322_1_plen_145_part_00
MGQCCSDCGMSSAEIEQRDKLIDKKNSDARQAAAEAAEARGKASACVATPLAASATRASLHEEGPRSAQRRTRAIALLISSTHAWMSHRTSPCRPSQSGAAEAKGGLAGQQQRDWEGAHCQRLHVRLGALPPACSAPHSADEMS